METVSISQHNPYPDNKTSLLPDNSHKAVNSLNLAALLGLLSGDKNEDIIEVRFEARSARNFW